VEVATTDPHHKGETDAQTSAGLMAAETASTCCLRLRVAVETKLSGRTLGAKPDSGEMPEPL